jgi:xylulokinase
VIEGIAFNLCTGLQAFQQNGAANSDLLLQVFADVWGLPIRRRNLVDEATALGAAIVGGVGVGMFDSFEIANSCPTGLQRLRRNRVDTPSTRKPI